MVLDRWSWSRGPAEADAFRAEASRLVGQRLARVRYVTLDFQLEAFPDASGPRCVESPAEWNDPDWSYAMGDCVEHAVELELASGEHFTVSWESPGEQEGIGLRQVEALGSAVRADARVAVWDVTERSRWSGLIGSSVRSVDLEFRPSGDSDALWCDQIDVLFGSRRVQFRLATPAADGCSWTRSSDDVAVIFG